MVEQEISIIAKNLNSDEKNKNIEKNEKIAKSRIKLGLLLNELGEKNNLKVSEEEVRNEIQKQIKGMPGQEKMIIDYYQKNTNAAQSLRSSIYEEKIIDLIKSNKKIQIKEVHTKEAEKIISAFNKPNIDDNLYQKTKSPEKAKSKPKKLVKSNNSCINQA